MGRKLDVKKFLQRCKTAATPKRRLKLLAQALEHEEVFLDRKFRWDFTTPLEANNSGENPGFDLSSTAKAFAHAKKTCGTTGCAMGMAAHIFPEYRKMVRKRFDLGPDQNAEMAFFGLSYTQVVTTFLSTLGYDVQLMHDVTPEMVAERLRKLAEEM